MGSDFLDTLIDGFMNRLSGSGKALPTGTTSAHPFDTSVDRKTLARLLQQHETAWANFDYREIEDLGQLASNLTKDIFEEHDITARGPFFVSCALLIANIIRSDPAFSPPDSSLDPANLSPVQLIEHTKETARRIHVLTAADALIALTDAGVRIIDDLLDRLPGKYDQPAADMPNALEVRISELIREPHMFMAEMISYFINYEPFETHKLYPELRRQIFRNTLEASGVFIDPDKPLLAHDCNRPVFPNDCKAEPAEEVAARYFANTPILDIFSMSVPYSLPEKARFEHMHILAGTGHGKTQTLQHLIVSDLLRPAGEVPSMVILDSQGDMLNTLMKLSLFDPKIKTSLARRLLIVDPSDVEFAPALNLFDIQSDRLKDYSQKDREQVLAGIIEIYDYIFGGLLGAELSQKQGMVFRFLAQLMLEIPGATIHTLRDLLIDASPFMEHISRLPDTARGFFETQFFGKGYSATREQILRRLYGVLQNPSFERMFAQPRNRLDLFDVLNNGGIVLVNTAKDFMKTDASSMFGRYIIALTFKAAMERAILPEKERRPTFLWIDEASEYFDDNIDSLLIQARKYKLGLVMAHQYLGQLPRGLRASIMSNTSIKLAGGISNIDARIMAPEMRASPDFLTNMTKEENVANFAAFVRNHTPQAICLSVPFLTAENMDEMPDDSFEILLNASRKRLSIEPAVAVVEPVEPTRSADPVSTIPQPIDDDFWEEGVNRLPAMTHDIFKLVIQRRQRPASSQLVADSIKTDTALAICTAV